MKITEKPIFKRGDTSTMAPHWAKGGLLVGLNERVGLEVPVDSMEHFLEGLKRTAGQERIVRIALETCIRCGACLDACPTFIATGDLRNSPVGRADLVRNLLEKGNKGPAQTAARINEIATYYYQCLECRKCGAVCPLGIDQADLTRVVRSLLQESGLVSKYLATVIDASERSGNNMSLKGPAIMSTVDFVREEIRAEKGVDVHVKSDQPSNALLAPPSADFFANLETLKGYMLFLHEIGLDYTFTTEHAEIGNFGLFNDSRHMRVISDHLVRSAEKLGTKLVIAGECGHAWRAFRGYVIPELRKHGIRGVHILQLVKDAVLEGRLTLDPSQNPDVTYVYQDPCNLARGGDMTEEPRFVLSRVVRKTKESPHNRRLTWCCGGSAGLLADELLPLSLEYARLWHNDAMSVGADHIVRPCAICKAQMGRTLPILEKGREKPTTYSGLMDLLYRAIVPKN